MVVRMLRIFGVVVWLKVLVNVLNIYIFTGLFAISGKSMKSVHNWPVSCATAKVSLQILSGKNNLFVPSKVSSISLAEGLPSFFWRSPYMAITWLCHQPQSYQTYHSWGTITTLRTSELRNSFLDRMETGPGRSNTLGRENSAVSNCCKRKQAGIDGPGHERFSLPIVWNHNNGASPTTTLSTLIRNLTHTWPHTSLVPLYPSCSLM